MRALGPVVGLWAALASALPLAAQPISLPEEPRVICKEARLKLYAGCLDQRTLFAEARALAAAEGKALMVAFGAEWCIWCHIFDAALKGTLPVEDLRRRDRPAYAALPRLAEAYVVVHIDGDAEGGFAVLQETGARDHFRYAIPFIFTVDADGRFVAAIYPEQAEYERDGAPAYALPAIHAMLLAAGRGETLELPIRDQRGRVRLGVTGIKGWEMPWSR